MVTPDPAHCRCMDEYVFAPISLSRAALTNYQVFTLPIFSFPSNPKPNAKSFDWAPVFFVGLLALVLPWYFLRAKKWFVGPGERIDMST